MRTLMILMVVSLATPPLSRGQSVPTAESPAPARVYHLLREDDDWGQQPFMNAYLNERYMLYFDVHYGKHVRSFVEFKSGLNSYRIGGPRPIDEKKLDFQAAFLEVGMGDARNWIKVRAGRHELEYAAGRLIDVCEVPHVL